MEKQTAIKLINYTLENPFDKGRFTFFVKNLLNSIEDAPFSYKGNFIPDAYEQYIGSLERIGKYTAGEHKIDILIVKLKKKTSIERARTMQRNFIAWYLNGSRGGEMKDAALAAFIAPNEEDWRFSLVKMDYRFEEGKGGRVKIKEEFTPARRWSFLVGKNENSHTAQSRLVPILEDDKNNPTLAELEEAFNIEKVTKEFFEKYRDLFLRTKEMLDEVISRDANIKEDFKTKGVNTVDFAKKLLGQIVFLYFLQKKGWFGVAKNKNWGEGDKQFLRSLFKKASKNNKNYFNDFLEPLFYEALRNDRSHEDHYFSMLDCKIPFLNGGLFDPMNDYDWTGTDLELPDELFSNMQKTKEGDTGNGILDIFDRYNFTVKEDEPLEKEVAVDPEMLGKVFENLLEVKDRKSKGTYYTPREIVHYMCQQSLINYLYTTLNDVPVSYEKLGEEQTFIFKDAGKKTQLNLTIEHRPCPVISKEEIETLIKYGEQLGENEAIVEAKGRETKTYAYKLSESIRQSARLIDDKLANIKVCDPAIGSGAFPVGMMSEIVKTRNVLSAFIKDPHRTVYTFKRECIEKSLYGVDIDPSAVEIAKLRLWLSLVVDEEDIKQIKPLPNLDYKIVCGNSLLGVEKNLFNDVLFKELERIKPLLFNETSPKKKQEYKNQIDDLISKITDGHKEFDFEVYFSEVFHEKKGFDVVIGNPPYVLLQSGNRDDALNKYFRQHYKVASYKIDLYHLFIEQGVNVLKNAGTISFITPSNFTSNNYSVPLRRFLLTETAIEKLVFFGENVFDASVHNLVLIAHKIKRLDLHTSFFKAIISDGDLNVELKSKMTQAELVDNMCLLVMRTGNAAESIIGKMSQAGESFGSLATVNFGMQLRDRSEFEQDVVESPANKASLTKFHRECYAGKDVHRFYVTFTDRYCYFNRVAKRGGCWDEAIHNAKGKILVRQIGDYPEGGIDTCGYAVLNAAFMILPKTKKIDSKFLLGVLNSAAIRFYWLSKFRDDRKTFPKIKGEYLKLLPLPNVDSGKQAPIVQLVNQILAAKKKDPNADTSALERQIDEMVYKFYSLTDEEIKIVEKSVQ